MNLVEIAHIHLVETCHHMHTQLTSSRERAIICTYTSRLTYVRELMTLTLGIDWADGVCLDSYIHSSTGAREPHDVL